MRVNISVPDRLADEVRRRSLPVSAICQRALRDEVGRLRAADVAGMQTLTVHVGDSLPAVRFTGRWLIDPDTDRAEAPQRYFYYGVAITGRGRIAVLTASDEPEETNDLRDYDSLDHAARDGVPPEIISKAATALGQDPAIWRDI